jgi:hypothetical protein
MTRAHARAYYSHRSFSRCFRRIPPSSVTAQRIAPTNSLKADIGTFTPGLATLNGRLFTVHLQAAPFPRPNSLRRHSPKYEHVVRRLTETLPMRKQLVCKPDSIVHSITPLFCSDVRHRWLRGTLRSEWLLHARRRIRHSMEVR